MFFLTFVLYKQYIKIYALADLEQFNYYKMFHRVI